MTPQETAAMNLMASAIVMSLAKRAYEAASDEWRKRDVQAWIDWMNAKGPQDEGVAKAWIAYTDAEKAHVDAGLAYGDVIPSAVAVRPAKDSGNDFANSGHQ